MEVRVRTAPSPTGLPHIGNTWAALINYLFAKKNKGKFIFRLEDTDKERFVEGSPEALYETLKWLGLNYDEGPDIGGPYGPYVQSERLDLYKKYANELIEKGFAYKDEGAIRFKVAKTGETSWHDLVGDRQITFPNNIQEDFVILKSDGYPTYNFAHIIDDHLMKITHVIRGGEFIPSVPKYIMLHEALGWEVPQYAHLPLLLGTDKSKLSKRHGAKSVLEFRKDGYLKEAILNFMALLGWYPPSGKEFLTLDEMIEEFDLKDINLASPIFDVGKLEWLNSEYIRKTQDSKLKSQIWEYLMYISEGKLTNPSEGDVEKAIPIIKTRIKKLSDFIPLTDFLWEKPEYDINVFNKLKIKSEKLEVGLKEVIEKLKSLKRPWKAQDFEINFRQLAKELDLSATEMFQIIRVAISGQTVTPPLFESMQILGEEEAIARIKEALNYLKSHS